MDFVLLEIKNLNVSYNKIKTINNVSFSVNSNTIVGIVGESGSGKSTLLKSIMGLLGSNGKIDSGKILLDEKEIDYSSSRSFDKVRGKHISMIFQQPELSLDPTQTIISNFYEVLANSYNLDKKSAKEKAKQLLNELELFDEERILNSYPFELSGGINQRVAIALAMALEPKIILADEPTSALDVTVQIQVINNLMKLKSKTSILLVTHNIGVVGYMADTVGIMYKGKIIEWGDKKEILTNPVHPYTKALIACVPTVGGSAPQFVDKISLEKNIHDFINEIKKEVSIEQAYCSYLNISNTSNEHLIFIP